MACLTRAGAYSVQATPALAAATSTTPRAWPTGSAMRASAPAYDSSSATASGACSAMSVATASWIVFKRTTVSSPAGVDQQPCATSLRRPSLSWTIPYPQAAVPGSMPTTFTTESYGPGRTSPRPPGRRVRRRRPTHENIALMRFSYQLLPEQPLDELLRTLALLDRLA